MNVINISCLSYNIKGQTEYECKSQEHVIISGVNDVEVRLVMREKKNH